MRLEYLSVKFVKFVDVDLNSYGLDTSELTKPVFYFFKDGQAVEIAYDAENSKENLENALKKHI